jgi:sirohydrochlorin ferrochelatase
MSEVLIGVAHGSRDPRAADTVSSLMSLVRARLDGTVDVRTAYLGHAAPSLPSVLSAAPARSRITVLPLLLTDAYHSKVDIPRLLPAAVAYGVTLGPHPLLITALERRLSETAAEDRAGTGVVLAAAGSSDPGANAAVARLAARWQLTGGWRAVVPGYASAAAPTPGAAVRGLLSRSGVRRVVVATYLLSPGVFADRIRREALDAGAAAVSPVLGAAPELADIVLEHFRAARIQHRAAA